MISFSHIRTIERNADVLLSACKDIGLAVNIGKTKYMEIGCHRANYNKCAYQDMLWKSENL